MGRKYYKKRRTGRRRGRLGLTRTSKTSRVSKAAGIKRFGKRKGKRSFRRSKRGGFKRAVQKIISDQNIWKQHVGSCPFDTNGAYNTQGGFVQGAASANGQYGYFSMECFTTGAPGTGSQYSPFAPIQTVGGVTAATSNWYQTAINDWGLNQVAANSGNKIEIDYAKLKGHFTNVCNFPIITKIYKCKWRTDEGSGGLATLGGVWTGVGLQTKANGGDGLTTDWTMTPFQAGRFCAQIKILSAKTKQIGPGETLNIKCKAPGIKKGKYYDAMYFAQQPVSNKYTVGYLIFHHGVPGHDSVVAGQVTTAPSRLVGFWEAKMKTRIQQPAGQNINTTAHITTFNSLSNNLQVGPGNANNPTVATEN